MEIQDGGGLQLVVLLYSDSPQCSWLASPCRTAVQTDDNVQRSGDSQRRRDFPQAAAEAGEVYLASEMQRLWRQR